TIHVSSNFLVLAVEGLLLQYVALNIDQVHGAHTIGKASVLNRYQAHFRAIADGEIVRTFSAGLRSQWTSASQYRFHFHLLYSISKFGLDNTSDQTYVGRIVSCGVLRDLTIGINHGNYLLSITKLTVGRSVRCTPVNYRPFDFVL